MQTDEQAIRDLVATWLSASKAGDVEKLLSLVGRRRLSDAGGRTHARQGGVRQEPGGAQKFDFEASGEIREIRVCGEWAYCWTHLTVAITPRGGGKAVTRAGPTLSILQKQKGAWVTVRDANMLTVV